MTKILEFLQVDSTNDQARRLIMDGCAEDGLVVFAYEQSAGRGRYGRVWASTKGNLHASIICEVDDDLLKTGQISFVACVSIGVLLESLLGEEFVFGYKWPNDVLVDGKKISGVLLESVKQDGRNWVIVGVGINIGVSPKVEGNIACKLNDFVTDIVSVDEVLRKFIEVFWECLMKWRELGFADVKDLWLRYAIGVDKSIKVICGAKEIDGLFAGISDRGELELHRDGRVEYISSGEVFFD